MQDFYRSTLSILFRTYSGLNPCPWVQAACLRIVKACEDRSAANHWAQVRLTFKIIDRVHSKMKNESAKKSLENSK